MFGKTANLERELIESIEKSIMERKENLCST
jgi:hypothetical protein